MSQQWILESSIRNEANVNNNQQEQNTKQQSKIVSLQPQMNCSLTDR
jgi:hypothetical protein